ncbi:MAG: sulfite exporter TauE/SafE family protein [Planctomycetes bacterium]|nr:sulfite exporter TauE/SafE family protein [Planctomycetota bacterium]
MLEQLGNPWWAFVVLGICAGMASGTLGIGGGVILVPGFVLLLAFPQKSAQGMALAVMVPTALVGAFRYWRHGDVEMDLLVIGLVVCGTLAGTLIGTQLAHLLPSHVLRKIFAVVLVIVAVKMFIGPSRSQKAAAGNVTEQSNASLVEPGGTGNESAK